MLRSIPSILRRTTHYSAPPQYHLTRLGTTRCFWFGKDKGENKGKETAEERSGHNQNSIIKLGIGDDAPKPSKLVALPVSKKPLFPRFFQMVQLRSPELITALEGLKNNGDGYVGVFLRKQPVENEGDPPEIITSLDDIYKVGTFAQIQAINPTQWGGVQVMLLSHRRVGATSLHDAGPPALLGVEHWAPGEYDPESPLVKAYSNEIVATVRDLIQTNPLLGQNAQYLLSQHFEVSDPFRLSDFAASLSSGKGEALQALLEERGAERRLELALELITREREVARLQEKITKQVEEKMSEQQRRYMLTEQLKTIKKELGMEKDDKAALTEKYRERLRAFEDGAIPKEARKTIDEELEKLEALEKNSPEFNVTKNYLDWLTSLPWGKFSEETFDVAAARAVLDAEHHGLEDVKERVLEFIAVGRLRGAVHGKILCLAGPPGVGKTSIGRSIARALNREYYRFSVGGLSDVAEIKGHRRTYIGAMPGKVVQCLKSTQTSNPLILIDEIDKLGRGHQGDPASALLELLDPAQNGAFHDHYLDVPVDLSKALFLCTANQLETIPGPLADRMEIIRLSGYDLPDKLAIAEQYLIPKAMAEAGLTLAPASEEERGGGGGSGAPAAPAPAPVALPPGLAVERSAVEALARWYCREAGVRNLEQHIQKICRKLAHHVVRREAEGEGHAPEGGWAVASENLAAFVGKPVFTSDRLYEGELPPGVVMGLAWTALGGASLYVETAGTRRAAAGGGGGGGGGGALEATGQLKDVMRESTRIAHVHARRFLQGLDPGNGYFDDHNVHLHVPEGATPKDGPSAGITMCTSLLSLALDKPVRSDIAMTGELSLTGKVLPVGGIKEKTIAARRSGIHCLVFPEGNRRDFEELPAYLREGLEAHFAATYADVYRVAFSFSSSASL